MPRKSEYPKTVKSGAAQVRIYKEKNADRVRWCVYYRHNRKPVRARFKSEFEALDAARQTLKEINQGKAGTVVNPKAVEIFNELLEMVDGDVSTLFRAVDEYRERMDLEIDDKLLSDVAAELLADRKGQSMSYYYLNSMRGHLKRICNDFQGAKIGAISGPLVQRWLNGLSLAPRSVKNNLTTFSTLIEFSRQHGYLSEDADPLKRVKAPKQKPSRIEIYSPSEMAALLQDCPEPILAYLLIGGFCGLRTEEIKRLDWSDVSRKHIVIEADKAKTGARRIVNLPDNLKSWLNGIRKTKGLVIRHKNLSNEISKWMKRPGERPQWRHNALRHSFCSYRLAQSKDAAATALEAGHSATMLFKHYRELVTEDSAKQWFSITPEIEGQVLTPKFQAV